MKKIAAFMLLFVLGMGSIAYALPEASSCMDGPAASQISAQARSCCEPGQCDCQVRTAPKYYDQNVTNEAFSVSSPGAVLSSLKTAVVCPPHFSGATWLFLSSSPPKADHLHTLYSLYRI